MLPFELRDLKNDNPNLGTIPQLIGVKGTKQLSIWLSAIITTFNIIYFTDHKQINCCNCFCCDNNGCHFALQ